MYRAFNLGDLHFKSDVLAVKGASLIAANKSSVTKALNAFLLDGKLDGSKMTGIGIGGQISTFDIPFFESADPFVDLFTENASRNEGQGIKAYFRQTLSILHKSASFQCQMFRRDPISLTPHFSACCLISVPR
jgi:hypothetical protein